MHGLIATRAYQARSANRSLRDQEADVFRRATASLRQAQTGDEIDGVRAIADNRMLWSTVMMLLHDPENGLPAPLRGSIISIGMAVEREMNTETPDLPFLIGINEQMTTGLAGI